MNNSTYNTIGWVLDELKRQEEELEAAGKIKADSDHDHKDEECGNYYYEAIDDYDR